MAFSINDTVTLGDVNGTFTPAIARNGLGVAIVAYTGAGSTVEKVRLISTAPSLSIGTALSLTINGIDLDLSRIQDFLHLLVLDDTADDESLKGCIINGFAAIPTESAYTMIDDEFKASSNVVEMLCCVLGGNLGLVLWRWSGIGGDARGALLGLSSSGITSVSTKVDSATTYVWKALTMLDGVGALAVGDEVVAGNPLSVIYIDCSGAAPVFGAADTESESYGSGSSVYKHAIAKLSSTKAVFAFKNGTQAYAYVVTISAGVPTLGPRQDIHDSVPTSVLAIPGDKVVISYEDGYIESYTVSGTTITANGDSADAAELGPVAIVSPDLLVSVTSDADSGDAVEIGSTEVLEDEPAAAKFYQGEGILTYRSDLPFAGVNPGAMAISPDGQTAVLGANAAAAQMIAYASNPWSSWTNMTTPLPTGTAVTSIKYV